MKPQYLDLLITFQRDEIDRSQKRMQAAVSGGRMKQETCDWILDRMNQVLRVLQAARKARSPGADAPAPAETKPEPVGQAIEDEDLAELDRMGGFF